MALQHVERAGVLHDAVGLRRIDLDDVAALGLQAAEAHQVLHVLRREQVLAGRERAVVGVGDLGERREVERIARLLEPAQLEGRHRLGIGERLVAVELASWRRPRARRGCRRSIFTASMRLHVLGERHAADLHLHHGVAGIEMPPHLVLQVLGGLARRVPAAADIAEHLVRHLAAVVALGQHAMQRLACDLGDRVPDRDLDGADADRALAVAAGFLVPHHHGEDFFRIEIVAGLVRAATSDRPSGCAG